VGIRRRIRVIVALEHYKKDHRGMDTEKDEITRLKKRIEELEKQLTKIPTGKPVMTNAIAGQVGDRGVFAKPN
jgi:hypothetical protein